MKRFFNYVEIQTKIASVIPFLLGLCYVFYTYGTINLRNTILFFLSMLLFDMATTALNNFIDTRTNGHPLSYARRTAFFILLGLLFAATATGLLLVWYAGLVVFACGTLCFLIGIFYTFGPTPISRLPLGELFSGFFMGFFIPFLTVYINAPVESLVDYSFQGWIFQMTLNLSGMLKLLLLCIPCIMCIANIMLANNICDLDADRKNNRLTLPHYIGIPWSLRLFTLLYLIAYVAIVLMAIFQVLPAYVLVVLLGSYVAQKNIRAFYQKQSKSETFPLCIQNFLVILVPLLLVAGVAIALDIF